MALTPREAGVLAGAPCAGDVARLTGAIAAGDTRAFAGFYRVWFDRAFALARGLTRRDEAFCLDAAQEVMLRAARCLPVLAAEAELVSWIAKTTMSVCVDALRREARRARRERAPRGGDAASAHDPELAEEIAALARAMRGLCAEDHSLLVQRIMLGRSLKEAGAAAGLGVQAAHGRIRRALERLRMLAKEIMP